MKDIKFIGGWITLALCLVAPCAAQQSGASTAQPRPSPTPQASGPAPASTMPAPLNLNVKASERAVDNSIPDDPKVDSMLGPYSAKVHELEKPIGKLVGEMKRDGMGGGAIGNFVADALRNRAERKLGKPVLLAVVNTSGLRKTVIAEGDVSTSDIYELLPFENALVTLDLTGEQLRRFLDISVARRNAQSGARITYRTNDKKENEIVMVKLGGGANGAESEIDPKATYTIVTIDYLVKRGGDYSVLQEGKNVHPLGVTLRDAVIDYVKEETAAGRPIKATLDGRFRYDKPAATGSEQPQ